jgi:Mg-chelatase subunit ChlD
MNRLVSLSIVWFTLVATAAGQQALSPANDQPAHISVDVDLVVLQATVTDRHGQLVTDLTENNFQVYEDGVLQQIRLFRHEDVPVAVGLVVDHSGSMQRKLAEVSAAARIFVHSSNPDDQMFVVNFNEKVTFGLQSAIQFSHDATELESAILTAPAGGKTALYDPIAEALEQLKASTLDKKVLIVISDGGDNASTHTLNQVLNLADQSNAIIYTHWHLRRRRSGPQPSCSQSPCTHDWRPGILPRQSERCRGHLHAYRARHPQPVHHWLRSYQPHPERRLPGDPSRRTRAGPRKALCADSYRVHRAANKTREERKHGITRRGGVLGRALCFFYLFFILLG